MGGTHAVVRIGQVHIIITERRKPFHKRSDFLALGLDPLKHTLTIVKIGYLEPELKAMAAMHRLILSPGAVQPQLTAIPYQNLTRPIFPLEKDFSWQPSPQLFNTHPTQRNHNNPDSA
jgi:microcystin degradation protein MlrC